jgi:hypothetical protein
VTIAILVSPISTALSSDYGDAKAWLVVTPPTINGEACDASATVKFTEFLAHMDAVRDEWLNRDESADFYGMRGMSILAYIISKKVASLMTYQVYETLKDKHANMCGFHVYVLTHDKSGNDKIDLLVSWMFTRQLADKVNWSAFDDKNFPEVAQSYALGPNVQGLTSQEPSSDSPSAEQRIPQADIKDMATFTGRCRFQLVSGFFPCDSKVAYVQLSNGRSFLTFSKGDVSFSLSGGETTSRIWKITTSRLTQYGWCAPDQSQKTRGWKASVISV